MKKLLLLAVFLLWPCAVHADDDLSVHSDGKPMKGDDSLSVHPNPNAAPADLPQGPNDAAKNQVPPYYQYYDDGKHNHGPHHPLGNSTTGHDHDMDDSTTGHHHHDHDMDGTTT